MKKLAILLLAVAALAGCKGRNQSATQAEGQEVIVTEVGAADMHNSQTSLDYIGTYKGTLPCADCEGIATTITLDQDGNFTRTMNYLGAKEKSEFSETGKYKWNADGSIIELEGVEGANKYQVGENKLFHLDMDGKRVTGELADYYVLVKQ